MPFLVKLTLFFVCVGSAMLFLPYPLWWLLYGCRHKGSQPHDDILVALRSGGMAVIIFGTILLFFTA